MIFKNWLALLIYSFRDIVFFFICFKSEERAFDIASLESCNCLNHIQRTSQSRKAFNDDSIASYPCETMTSVNIYLLLVSLHKLRKVAISIGDRIRHTEE